MYYPIIDKLKELMTDLTSVKEKEPLIINATLNNEATSGTWQGEFNDIINSLINGRQVILKASLPSSAPFQMYAVINLVLTDNDISTGEITSIYSNVFMSASGPLFVQLWPENTLDVVVE